MWPKNWSGSSVMWFLFLLVLVKFTHHVSASFGQEHSEVIKSTSEKFWNDVNGEEFIEKLNSFDLEKFNKEHSDTFIMFYANWCKSSVQAKDEFANTAKEFAYTEGYSKLRFGAFDCNSTLANKKVCNRNFNITTYPRFLYFENGKMDRMYTVKCPRYTEFFYNWIVSRGNENYCSGSLSSAATAPSAVWHPTPSNAVQMSCLLTLCFRILFYDIFKN